MESWILFFNLLYVLLQPPQTRLWIWWSKQLKLLFLQLKHHFALYLDILYYWVKLILVPCSCWWSCCGAKVGKGTVKPKWHKNEAAKVGWRWRRERKPFKNDKPIYKMRRYINMHHKLLISSHGRE